MKLIQKILLWSVVAALLVLGGCSAAIDKDIPELIEPRGMEPDVAVAAYGEIFNVVTLEGLVLPYIHELSFEANGLIDEVLVTVGSEVKAGDIVARLDSEMYEKSLTTAENNLAFNVAAWELNEKKAEAEIEIAKIELEVLVAEGASSVTVEMKKIEIAELENKLNTDKALWELTKGDLEQNIEQLRAQVACSILTAPCDGTIVYSSAIEGGYAMADSALFRLAEDANLYISSDYVTADQVDKAVEIYGTVAGKKVEVEYIPMDRVEFISRNDSGEDMCSTFIVSDAGDAEVTSGMSSVIFIITEREDNALIVPACAVRQDINGNFVYIMDENGTQIRRNIKRGIYNDAYVQIVEGLKEGDVIYAGN